ncbi:hypothetical protein [Pedobacter gandavensis]|uniref:Uncharacterized protein n=1 Tax=Pedobacter gandavensis TaxID=2679963 RepID=A0ABR6EV49_9SPHI|nr:hypothetical protein [Pedobacter gandavensis]MBB2149149.1 hypothetical protein [Pedobacter gandavensis]
MIIADIVPQSENLFFVRFSDPNEDFGNKPYFTVKSIEEVKRRMYFHNRLYVVEKLKSWLKQRLYAMPSSEKEISLLLCWISEIEKRGFTYICDFIKRKRLNFESIAPAESSKYFNYYTKTIVPILKFCAEEYG